MYISRSCFNIPQYNNAQNNTNAFKSSPMTFSGNTLNIVDPLTELRWKLSTISNKLKIGIMLQLNAEKNGHALGLNNIKVDKYINKHGISILPDITKPIRKIEPLTEIELVERHTKTKHKGILTKIKYDDRTRYVLKQDDKYCGSIDAIQSKNNQIKIDYLTNIFGREKFKDTENILIQSMIEDYMKEHKQLPQIKCEPVNVAKNMNRMYNNHELYKKMGMHDISEKEMIIEPNEVSERLKKYIKSRGEILKGTSQLLEDNKC